MEYFDVDGDCVPDDDPAGEYRTTEVEVESRQTPNVPLSVSNSIPSS